MDLRSILSILRRWLWLIALCTLVAGAGAYLFSKQQTPIFAAGSTVFLNSRATATGEMGYQDLLAQERLANTYVELLRGRDVKQEVIRDLGTRPAVLDISINTRRNTGLLSIVVESEDRAAAVFVANHLPEIVSEQQRERQAQTWVDHKAALNEEIRGLERQISETRQELVEAQAEPDSSSAAISALNSQLSLQETTYEAYLRNLSEIRLAEAQETNILSVIEPAQVPVRPVRPRVLLNTLIAALLGGMIGLGIAFLIEILDDTIKNESDIARFNLGTLASIERMDTGGQRALVSTLGNRSPIIEAYRMLRTNIRFALVDEELHSLVVTSPAPGEGKSTTAANLAMVIAQSGQKTILVDADLRRPVQHSIFKLPNHEGLTTALIERGGDLRRYLQGTNVEGLQVLSSGPLPPNPAELLGSQRMRDLLHELEQAADIVILDMPPVLAVADSSLVASEASGVLLVLRANATRMHTAEKAIDQLRSVKARMLGVVLNGVRAGAQGYYYYYYPTNEQGGETKQPTLGEKMRALMLSVVPRRG